MNAVYVADNPLYLPFRLQARVSRLRLTQTYSGLLGLTQTNSDLLRLTRTVTSQLLLKIVLFGLPWGYGLPLVYPVALVFHLIAR